MARVPAGLSPVLRRDRLLTPLLGENDLDVASRPLIGFVPTESVAATQDPVACLHDDSANATLSLLPCYTSALKQRNGQNATKSHSEASEHLQPARMWGHRPGMLSRRLGPSGPEASPLNSCTVGAPLGK
jgi:hypothetical protein